jgi:hypothetical protein
MADLDIENVCEELCRDCITRFVPDESPFFDTVWQAVHSRIFPKDRVLPPEEWMLAPKSSGTPGALGLQGVHEDLATISIVSTLCAVVIEMLSSGRSSQQALDSLLSKYGDAFGTPVWAISHIKSLVAARIDRPAGKSSKAGKAGTPEDIGRIPADTEDHGEAASILVTRGGPVQLSLGIDKGQLQVLLNGKEDVTFRSRERLFCPLLRLAAARKVGAGWLHKENDLHEMQEGTHAYYELANHLAVVTGNRDILKADRGQGTVRLEVRREAIKIQKSVRDFESRHTGYIKNLLEEIPGKEPGKTAHFDLYSDRLFREALGLARNSLLGAEAGHDLGWSLTHTRCLDVLDTFLPCVPEGRYKSFMFAPVRDLTEQLRRLLAQ